MKRIKPMKMIKNNQSVRPKGIFSRFAQGILLACLMLGFGFAELQAQDVASFYNSVGGELTNEITLEPGESFDLVIGVDNTGLVDGVTATLLFNPDEVQVEGGITDLVGFALPIPFAMQVDNENGYITFTKGNLGGAAPAGGFEYMSLTFVLNPDIAVNTTSVIDHKMEGNDMSNIVYFGAELLQDAPSFFINIDAGVEPWDCPELELNIGDACDDGDDNTENDTVTADCECVGTPVATDCLNESMWPSNIVSAGDVQGDVTISGCNYEEEYSHITNIQAGFEYTFSNENGSYITVREGAVDGPVIGAGFSPLTVTSTDGSDLFPHWNVDADCNTASSCMDTWVNCLTCPAFLCPELEANPGDACDDGDETTYNDTVTEDCECVGIPYDCTELLANIGDACDDGDEGTVGDTVTEDCECVGTPVAENDTCEEATEIACGETLSGTTIGANPETQEFCGTSDGSAGAVWYVYTATSNGTATASLCDADYDSKLRIYSGACGELSCVAGEDDDFTNCGGNDPYVEFDYVEGTTYYLLVHGFSSSEGNFDLSLTCVDGVDCPDLGLNIGASCDDGDDTTYDDVVTEDCECVGTPYDCPELLANVGDACDDGDENTINDTVTADCECVGVLPPANDLACDAIEMFCGDVVTGNNSAASNTADNCAFGGSSGGLDVWYTFTAESDMEVILETCIEGTDFDTDLNVYTGTCDALECFGGFGGGGYIDGDSGCEFASWASGGSFQATEGTTYTIRLSGYNASEVGNFALSLTCNIPFDCPELEANIGDACDDGDDTTENDMITEDCECVGTPIIVWDCPELEANIGDACDDGDSSTINDMVNENCECAGTPVEPGDCQDWVMYMNDNEGGETDIYEIEMVGGNAEMTYITTLDFHAHIAYNPADNLIYVVNNTTGYYVTVNPHVSPAVVSEPVVLSEDIPSITTAEFSPIGKLLVGSSTQDVIYSIDITDASVSVFDAYAPISGGDIAFNDEGRLFLGTRSGNGLYEVYPDDVMDDQFIANIPNLVTGMALADGGANLITSHNGNADLVATGFDGSYIASYPLMLDGESFMHFNGDLAGGCNSFNQPEEGECDAFSTFYADINRPGVSGTDLYRVEYTAGGDAIMTFLTNVSFNSHIGYNAQDDIVYFVNGNGSMIRAYDPTTNTFLGDLPIVDGPNSTPAVVYNPADGLLYIGSASANEIYSVDLGTGVATYVSDAPVNGGDLAIQGGSVYLASRNISKLFDVTGGGAVEISDIPSHANGMAQANNSTDLVIANNGSGVFTKISAADGSVVGSYVAMIDGMAVTLYDGDMAAGCADDEPLVIGDCYATELVEYVEGTTMGGGNIAGNRSDATQALNAPERVDELVFVSLGYGGSLTVGFGGIVPNGEGDDIEVVETSYNNPGCDAYPEFADVYVSMDGENWYMAGTVCKSDPFVDISDAGDFEYVSYVRVANNDGMTTSGDGFDVDGIVALHNCEDDGSGEEDTINAIAETSVLTSFPNPTNGPSQVVFTTASTTRTLVEVFDMNGRNVETLFNQVAQEGQEYRIDFNGSNLPNGVYIYKLTTDNETIVDKFMIAK